MPKPIIYSSGSRYIAKFSSAYASESWGIEELAFIILKNAKESRLLCNAEPTGIASAACYIASVLLGEKAMTIKKIAEIAEIAVEIIKNRYNYLVANLLFTVTL